MSGNEGGRSGGGMEEGTGQERAVDFYSKLHHLIKAFSAW